MNFKYLTDSCTKINNISTKLDIKMLFIFSSTDSDDDSEENKYLNKQLKNPTINTDGKGK